VKRPERIFLSTEAVDMRGGFDRLAGRVLAAGLDVYAGDLFVFVSRRRTHLKVLTWDGTGMVVTYKRMGRGRFTLPVSQDPSRTVVLDATQLQTLMAGSVTSPVRRSTSASGSRPRFDARERV
jgi:transposase